MIIKKRTLFKRANDLGGGFSSKTTCLFGQRPTIFRQNSRGFKLLQKEIEIKVWSRHSKITNEDLGKRFKIYNGKDWIVRKVVDNMVNHKFGEFSLTKKKSIHKLNKKKQVKKSQ